MNFRWLTGQKNNQRTKVLVSSALLLALAGCGGGSSDDSSGGGGGGGADILSGTAAAGAAIIGQVVVKGSAGNTVSALIEANGNYSVDVSTLTAPYMLRAQGTVGGRTYQLHSYAEAADVGGTVNVTPFTDLIVANAAGQIASSYFDTGDFSSLTTAEIEAQETALQAKLQDVLTPLGVDAAVDLLHSTFSADHTALDAALDMVRIEVDSSTNVATIKNLIDTTEMSDSLTDDAADDSGTLQVTSNLATVQTDYEAIATRFTDLSALFATGLPSSAQLDPFFSADFLDGDSGKAELITDISTDPSLIGLTLTSVSIEALDQAAGTATVSFHVAFNGVVDPEIDVWEMAKTAGGVWEMRGDREIVDRWASFICADGGCGINLGADDFSAANNNSGGLLVDSARVTLVRNGMPVTGVEIFMGVPAGGAAGELRIYDGDYADDYMGFGTSAFELDPSLIQVGDLVQFELYTTALDLTNTANPAVTGSPIATYTTPIVALPVSNGATASYPAATQATQNALAAFTGGNLAVIWTVPAGMQHESTRLEVCDDVACLDVEEWNLGGSTGTTLTLDTSSLDLTSTSARAELRVYAMDIYGQSFLTTYQVSVSTGGGGGGTSLTCATESGWDDTADGGLGAPITPYSFADFEAAVADCASAQVFTRTDIAGKSFDDMGETTTFNNGSAAATATDPETGIHNNGIDPAISFEWYVENATCTGCTHSYVVVYSDSSIDSSLPAGFQFRETSALTGQSGSTFSFIHYSEGSNYGDMNRSAGSDGEIWSGTSTLVP